MSVSVCVCVCVLSVSPQSHVMAGDQLVHSPFLQSLSSLTVGLVLDQLLCRLPRPPHHAGTESDGCPLEWTWLATYSTTVKSAEAFARGNGFPESFSVPEFQQTAVTEVSKALVSSSGRFTWLMADRDGPVSYQQ